MRVITITILSLVFIPIISSEPISLSVGVALVGAAGVGVKKYFFPPESPDDVTCWTDCCMELNTFDVIEKKLNEGLPRLFGQHVAAPVISKAILKHLNDKDPSKALTLSLHGLTGTGKNYVAMIIAEAMFTQPRNHMNVHFINCNLVQHELAEFKAAILKKITMSSKRCSRSLFVFDEFDKLPAGTIDVISEFFEYNSAFVARKSIFMFLSNTGGTLIAKAAIEQHLADKPREALTYQALSKLVQVAAFNENGGFKDSKLITRHLVDYFVPFLPLTHEHVLQCIHHELTRQNAVLPRDEILAIAESLNYFPEGNPIFSSSGCKTVGNQVNLFTTTSAKTL
uniref:Torsin n=1 Tax=Panagrellus redivivus TaxID=6233 RepID=A0A7E5A0Z5_PANRE